MMVLLLVLRFLKELWVARFIEFNFESLSDEIVRGCFRSS